MPEIQKLDPEQKLDMIIDGIEKLVDDKDHFYANTGAFSHGVEDWKKFRTRL